MDDPVDRRAAELVAGGMDAGYARMAAAIELGIISGDLVETEDPA